MFATRGTDVAMTTLAFVLDQKELVEGFLTKLTVKHFWT
jgi:hypothetical protein